MKCQKSILNYITEIKKKIDDTICIGYFLSIKQVILLNNSNVHF